MIFISIAHYFFIHKSDDFKDSSLTGAKYKPSLYLIIIFTWLYDKLSVSYWIWSFNTVPTMNRRILLHLFERIFTSHMKFRGSRPSCVTATSDSFGDGVWRWLMRWEELSMLPDSSNGIWLMTWDEGERISNHPPDGTMFFLNPRPIIYIYK